MRKTLYMHFRLRKRNHKKLGMSGKGVLARGGVTVAGVLYKDTIRWGATKCFDENYSRRIGREGATEVAFAGVYNDGVLVTKNLEYVQAREIAELIGHLVYRHGVSKGMELAKDTLLVQQALA